MQDLPLNALRAFALALEHGGVRAAARALGVSHSAVSRHLVQLERASGTRLIERGGGHFRATPAGRRLADATRGALERLQESYDAVREHRSPFALSVSTTASFAVRWLLPRLPALERAHPRLALSVRIEQRVEPGGEIGADFALRMGAGPWPDVDATPLMDDALYPVVAPERWHAAAGASASARLARLPLLHDRDPQTAWSRWRERYGPAGLDVRSGARFASSDLVLRAAAHGLGVALARHRLVADDIAAGTLLRPFGAAHIALGPSYWIVRTPDAAPRPALAGVISWLKREAAAAPPLD